MVQAVVAIRVSFQPLLAAEELLRAVLLSAA